MLAEAYEQAGQPEEGLCLLAEAMAHVDQQEGRGYEAELHRLKGVLLLSLSPNHRTEAEACFQQALDIARHHSLARLWQSQGKRQDACELLEPVYGWFTEGFDTADLQDAKVLLDELA
jgi:predicted ATPase